MGPPGALSAALKDWLELGDFIETGTFHGDTADWAAGIFDRVTTIELSEKYHLAATARFKTKPRIRLLQGNSPLVLEAVVPALATPALFWLDAHWSGLDTAGKANECPVIAEIAVIQSSRLPHVILVDDARLFCRPPPLPHRADQWPDLVQLVSALSYGQRYVVLDRDVLISVPREAKDRLVSFLQDTSRDEASGTGNTFSRLVKRIRS